MKRELIKSGKRLLFVDNLRTLLCLLVVFNHSTEAYGTGGWWYYQSAGKAPLLIPYTLIRAFYMMLFFMISGYFLPAAYDRKGAKAFIKDRLLRLGVPLLVFFLLIIPIMMYVYYVSFRGYGPISFWTYYLDIYFGFGEQPPDWTGPAWPDFQFGHLWFLQHLLVLDLGYVLWRAIRERFPERVRALLSPPAHWTILALIAALTGVTFFVRITHPIHHWIGIFDFIQTMMSDLPRDWCFFIVGVIAYRHDWFRRFPVARGRAWLRIGVVAMVLFSVLALLGVFSFVPGGFSWQAAVYVLWETIVGCGLCIGLLILFREKLNFQTPLMKTLGSNTYGVYLTHVPIVVLSQYLLGESAVAPTLKSLLVFVVAAFLAYVLSVGAKRLDQAFRLRARRDDLILSSSSEEGIA